MTFSLVFLLKIGKLLSLIISESRPTPLLSPELVKVEQKCGFLKVTNRGKIVSRLKLSIFWTFYSKRRALAPLTTTLKMYLCH